jgi:ATP-binding cassette subfamily C protein
MNLPTTKARSGSTLSSLWLLLCDFAGFAGTKGLKAIVFVFLGAIVEGIGLVLLIPFFSVIIDTQNTAGWAGRASAWLFAVFSLDSRDAKLGVLILTFAALMAARAVIITVRDVIIAQLQIGFGQHLRLRITGRLAAAPWDAVSRLRHSRITHLMSADIQQLESTTSILLRDAVAAIMLGSQVVLAFLLVPALAALALLLMLLGAATLRPIARRARGVGSFVTDANLSLIDDISQFLGALKLAISQNLQEHFTREFKATLDDLKAQQIHYVRQQTINRVVVATLSGLGGAAAIVLGVVVFGMPPPVLITLLLIVSRMNAPAMQLQLDAQHFAHVMPAYEKIRELEDDLAAAETVGVGPSVPPTNLSDAPVIFKGVTFAHQGASSSGGSAGGVRDLELVIEPGSIIGITGPSGAGKTTFADLLVGLYSPRAGEIRVGDVALRGLFVTAWRNGVSYVAQDPFLFHDTIRRNFMWANPDANEAALWEALRIVGAEDLVRNAAQGLETVVGERGSLLSGGERQRLCLARAILRRPHLLVLDEATSAIDIEGERALIERLLKAMPRPMTIVMIAHRLESLRHCHHILTFEKGAIVSDSNKLAVPKKNSELVSEHWSVSADTTRMCS